jgi:hypothetical protein
MGEVDLTYTRLIKFDLDSREPRLPALVTFQIPINIQNIMFHWCIIEEGAFTCIISKTVCQNLGSPEIVPSTVTLRAYDGRPSSSEGIFQNVLVKLGGKISLLTLNLLMPYSITIYFLDVDTCTL